MRPKMHYLNRLCVLIVLCSEWTLGQLQYQCCPENHIEVEDTIKCMDLETNKTTDMQITCVTNRTFEMDELFEIKSNGEGHIFFESLYPEVTILQANTFCLKSSTLENGSSSQSILICEEDSTEEDREQLFQQEVLGPCMISSCIFLALTAIIYLCLSELRSDLQGKSIISFCITLSISKMLLAILKMMSYSDMTVCAVRGFLTYYFILSSFFWMNAIAIQILLSIGRKSVGNYGLREFMWYALYSWGTPAVFLVIMVILNYIPGHHRSGIGLNHCWFFDLRRQWIYLNSIITILLVANIGIFIYTSVFLCRQSFASSHIRTLKYKLTTMLVLFILFGLPWVIELISSVCERHVVWSIFDVFNSLQGILIFLLLVVFRRRVIRAFYQRNLLFCLSGAAERWLALVDDHDENTATHTIAVPLNEQ